MSRAASVVPWNMQEFRTWVNSLPSDAVVGMTDDECHCPIASWRETFGEQVSVAPYRVKIRHSSGYVEYLAPNWICEFVIMIDESKAIQVKDEYGNNELEYRRAEVYPSDVLDVLDSIKRS